MGTIVKQRPVLPLAALLLAATLVPGPDAGAATPWQQAATTGPPGRFAAAMAYDPVAERVVLVGGCAGYTTTTATVRTKDDPETPLADERSAVTLDDFTWCAPSDTLSDVWTWNGTGWTSVTPTGPAPHARYGAALTYDYTAQRLTMFGGLYQTDTAPAPDAADADACIETEEHYGIQGTESVHDDLTGLDHAYYCFHDTWQLAHSGSTWSWVKLAPTLSPPARFQAGMSYDGAGHPTVAGGCHSLGMLGTHVQPTIPTTFGCAEYASVETTYGAHCPIPLVTINSPVCGTSDAYSIDSWQLVWAGGTPTWAQVGCTTPCAGPTPAYGMELAFDPATRSLHYWGGYYYEPVNAYNGYQGGVYSFDGEGWTQVLRAGKQDQWCNSLSAFMAFGASTPAWLDGRWQVLRTGGSGMYMSVRQQACPTDTADRWYDPTVNPAQDCPNNPTCPHITRPTAPRDWDDTWSWDEATCTPSDTDRNCWVFRGTGTPNARVGASIAYDVAAHQVVVFGGAPGLGDTWVYPTAIPPGDPCGTPCGL